MSDPEPDCEALLRVLAEHRIDFIVIGGVSAVLQGAPLTTFDLEVVHSRAPENLDRLLAALQALDAFFREQPSRRLRPDRSHLSSAGHQLLMTRHGPLDLLGTVSGNRGYDDLLAHTIDQPLGEGLRVRLLDLPTVILLKEETGRDKDMAVLPLLRRTLEEKGKA
jgi:hypothetical protein